MSRLDKIAERNRAANRKQTRTLVIVAVVVAMLALIGILLALGIGLPPVPHHEHRVDDIQLRKVR